MDSLTGKTIAQHVVKEKLGSGGMAEVYKAYHPRLDIDRAIKVIRRDRSHLEDFRRRFEKEAQLVVGLRHPNIVQIQDFGEQDGLFYMVMEFIVGDDLNTILRKRGRFSVEQTLEIGIQLAEALGAAHQQGLLHRDLKPANVMVNRDGLVVLMDFGIARMVDANDTSLTQTGVGIGTPGYMAPEQAMGEKSLTPACDVFALGIVLFELLTGELPYRADTPMAVLLKVLNDPMPMPRAINPDVPEALQNAILKATAKNPEDRFADGSLFADALRMLSRDAVSEIAAPTDTGAKDAKCGAAVNEIDGSRTSVRGASETQVAADAEVSGPADASETELLNSGGVGRVSGENLETKRSVVRDRRKSGLWVALAAALLVVVFVTYILRPTADAPLEPVDKEPPSVATAPVPAITQPPVKSQPDRHSLTVVAVPPTARVRILNIQPKYSPGMLLDAGAYHLEVSAPGYETRLEWVRIDRDETIRVDLRRQSSLSTPSTSSARFVARANDTLLDNKTRLVWQNDPYTAEEIALANAAWGTRQAGKARNWNGAKKYCRSLTFADSSDWRLPSADELRAIIDKSSPTKIDPAFRLPGRANATGYFGRYWSTTENPRKENHAFYASFGDTRFAGTVSGNHNSHVYFVRCVRGPSYDFGN